MMSHLKKQRLIDLKERNIRKKVMRESYDFSKSVQNPYAKHFKKQITIQMDEETILYFKLMSDKKGIPYQSLINLYLRDCANEHKELEIKRS
ncbi:MAG: BrnA antitoxin family protein [Mariprofundales bacterium]